MERGTSAVEITRMQLRQPGSNPLVGSRFEVWTVFCLQEASVHSAVRGSIL